VVEELTMMASGAEDWMDGNLKYDGNVPASWIVQIPDLRDA
jgi:hypothetical protein